jgi:hypothetical protein
LPGDNDAALLDDLRRRFPTPASAGMRIFASGWPRFSPIWTILAGR